MRVLQLSPVHPPARGGIETLGGEIARRLDAAVTVVTLAPDADADPGVTTEPGRCRARRVVRVRNAPRGGRRAVAALNARALLEGLRARPAVILVMHIKASPAAWLLGRLLRVPYVQYVHAKEMAESPDLAAFAVQRAARVIGVSRFSRDLAVAAGADPGAVKIVLNGVAPSAATEPEQPDPAPTLITVSRLEDRYKGHDVVLRALPAIAAAVPRVRWVVVGEGSLRAELQQAVDEAGLGDRVTFTGGVSDEVRDRLLGQAWAFVMPTRVPATGFGEGFGIVFLEAGAHGLPVIGGAVPGVVDAVLDEETGLLVDPCDPDAVAAAAIRLLTDRTLARELGEQGRRRAVSLAWPNVVAEVQALLEDVAAAPLRKPVRAPEARGWSWLGDLLRPPRASASRE